MTPEKRARIALRQGETAAHLGPIGLWEAQVELIARQIIEAVAAERAACAEIARTLDPDIGKRGDVNWMIAFYCRRAVMGHANTIADAIEERG